MKTAVPKADKAAINSNITAIIIWGSFALTVIREIGVARVDPKKTLLNIEVIVADINNTPTIIAVFLYESIFSPFY